MGLFSKEYERLGDERLMELVVRGDERAFAALYVPLPWPLAQLLPPHALARLGSARGTCCRTSSPSSRTDPVATIPARPFQTWLFSVANNMCKNAYRHEEVVRAAAINMRGETDRVEATNGIGVDHELFRGRLDEELDKLEPDHKATFVMRYHEDMAIKEIAAAFGCSEGTVKSRLFYTLKKLAERMKEFDPNAVYHGKA